MSTPSSQVRAQKLAEWHESLGAVWMEVPGGGPEVPRHYGSSEKEYGALRSGCGLLDRSWMGRLELTGEDRNRFLNGFVTCDVRELADGEGVYGFLTGPKGRILADVVIRARPDRLWLELPAGKAPEIAEHLTKFVIADRVEAVPLESMLPLAVLGTAAPDRLRSLAEGRELPDDGWRSADLELFGCSVWVSTDARLGIPAYTVWVAASEASRLAAELVAAGDMVPVGYEATDLIRIEEGIPWYGRDFGPDNLPQETGIEKAVSFDKGCYLGQEVVARLHYRGQVSRRLRALEIEVDEPPQQGTPLIFEGRQAGWVTSAVRSPVDARVVGIGLIQRRAMEPGMRLEVEGGGSVVVRRLGETGRD